MADIPIPRELVERNIAFITMIRANLGFPAMTPGQTIYPLRMQVSMGLVGDMIAMSDALRSALTQQAEGAVPVAEAMGALIAAWNRLAKIHGWTRAWEPEPGDDGWIPAHEQMQRAINALISAQPSGEVLTESAMDDIELPPLPRMTHYGGTAVVLSAAELRARDAEVARAALASAQPTEVCNVCGGVVLLTARPDTSAGKAIPSAQPAPTDAQIMATLDGLLVTGENQNYNGVYRYRSLGTPSHVTGPDLLEFARRVLALREVLVEVRAAEILRREAASIAECHTLGDGDWTGEEEAKAAHDEMLGVAAALSGPATAQATAESALYIGGPYHDGSMSVCELATGRIVHKFRLDGPSAPVGDGQAGFPSINSAPRDGTWILIMRPEWDQAVVAKWGEYGYAEGSEGEVLMFGWIFRDPGLLMGGMECGFLGWQEDADAMPTHWTHTLARAAQAGDGNHA